MAQPHEASQCQVPGRTSRWEEGTVILGLEWMEWVLEPSNQPNPAPSPDSQGQQSAHLPIHPPVTCPLRARSVLSPKQLPTIREMLQAC